MEPKSSSRKNKFRCSHAQGGTFCLRNLEKCRRDCPAYGECGDCKDYYIPAGQEPCAECLYLKEGGNDRGGLREPERT